MMMSMHRRSALLGLGASVAALAAGCAPMGTAAPLAATGNARKRSKFLFIAVDDLRPMMGHYGDSQIKTPNLDQLAQHLLTFDNAYTQVAVCGASRAALFTALRPERTGMLTHQERISVSAKGAPALHSSFKDAGFKTMAMGKVLHFADDAADGWTEPHRSAPRERAPGIPKEMNLNDSALDPKSAEIWRNDPYKLDGGPRRQPVDEAADLPDEKFRDGVITDMAIERLDQLSKSDEPFFMALGYAKPHLPFNAPKRYWDMYDRSKIKITDRKTLPTGAPEYAVTRGGEINNYSGLAPYKLKNGFNEEETRRLTHGYMACVSFIDAQLGKLVTAIKDNGLWDELTICLWGDHGYKLGDYNSWTKHTNYEIDTRVPLMLRVPGLTDKGERSDALVETVDIFPTLLQLADIPVPGDLEGISFAPLLSNPKQPWKSASFSQFGRNNDGHELMGYSVRTRNFRYVMWKDVKSDKIIAQELYDHRTDPEETKSVAADPAYAQTLAELRDLRLKGWKAALPKVA